jgi:hypothetical protein
LSDNIFKVKLNDNINLANSVTVVFNSKWIKGPPDDPIGIETCSGNKTVLTYICIVNHFYFIVLMARTLTFTKFVPCLLMSRSRILSVFYQDWQTTLHYMTKHGFMDVILKQRNDLNNGRVKHYCVQRTPDKFLLIWKTCFFPLRFMELCIRSLSHGKINH